MTSNVERRTFDSAHVADAVYDLARSDTPVAPFVREALGVIEQTLDTHG